MFFFRENKWKSLKPLTINWNQNWVKLKTVEAFKDFDCNIYTEQQQKERH